MAEHKHQFPRLPAAARLAAGVGLLALALPAVAAVPVEESRPSQGTRTAPPSLSMAAEGDREDTGTAERQPAQFTELFYQLQVLQQEVQELRGMVEEQNHRLERLARDQQEQYLDLDRRMQALRNNSAEPTLSGDGGGNGDDGPDSRARPDRGAGSGATGERQAYADAIELMREREFDASAAAFERLIEEYPNGAYTPNAFYWLGELHLAQDENEQARQYFAQVVNLYPDHHKVPDALFKLGLVYERLGDMQRAREYLTRVRDRHPDSDAARLARNHLAEL